MIDFLAHGKAAMERAPAVLLSTAFFSLGNGYEGSTGVMHFLQDFLGIVPLPLLGIK